MKHMIEWFTVQVYYSDHVPFALFGDLEKGSLFMSSGGRLCGPVLASNKVPYQVSKCHTE